MESAFRSSHCLVTAEEMSIMRRLRFLVSAMITAASPIAFVVTSAVAEAQAPSPGDSCTALHATTQDANGRTMWCNPTMTGNHSLVWQYGGPS
jgi:hypothetical protein